MLIKQKHDAGTSLLLGTQDGDEEKEIIKTDTKGEQFSPEGFPLRKGLILSQRDYAQSYKMIYFEHV